MKDTQYCPICGNKMRSLKRKAFNHFLEKKSDFIERTCTEMNHCFQLIIDEITGEVNLLKISLEPNYGKFIFIDLLNGKSKIVCLKANVEKSLEISKIIYPDFPDLKDLKKHVNTYLIFI